MSSAALIALDWGTTRARAFRIDATGRVLDTRSGDLGVQRLSGATFPQALAQLTGDWSDERAPRLACGMIGSRQGWREAPYLPCPASLEALSRGLVEVEGAALAIVPGLSTRDGSGLPDVMRGEETQIFGAVPIDAPRTLVVLPGSHSKWARVERGVVLDFTTYLTGELYDALVGHTILGRLATPAREVRPAPRSCAASSAASVRARRCTTSSARARSPSQVNSNPTRFATGCRGFSSAARSAPVASGPNSPATMPRASWWWGATRSPNAT